MRLVQGPHSTTGALRASSCLRMLFGLLVVLGSSGLAAQQTQPELLRYDYRIVNRYPHNINAFTQGLIYYDDHLYEGTGKNGQSSLSKIDLETGEVLMSTRLSSRYFGEGIEIVGDRIFQLTWRSNLVFVYNLADFEQVDTFYNATEGWGLTFDGEELILSDGSSTLTFLDPESFTPRREVQVTFDDNPVNNLNELEYIDGEVWANVWQTDYIVRIDPETGLVNSVVDLTGLSNQTRLGSREAVLNGIAWDSGEQRVFVTGKHWADLFEIELILP